MEQHKKRIINFRPIFFCFVGLMLGIICVVLAFKQKLFASVLLICLLTIFCFFIVLGIFVKNKFFIWCLSKCRNFFCFALPIIIGGILCFVQITNFTDKSFDKRSFEICGRVCEVIDYNAEYKGIVLENCLLNNNAISQNFFVTTYDSANNDNIKIGAKITFTSRIECVDVVSEQNYVHNFYAQNKIGYVSSFSSNDSVIENGNLHFDENVREKVKAFIDENMGADSAGIAVAVLVGDKNEINQLLKSYYSASGIAHLLSISGLHVNFLVALLYFILKKCKVNKYVRFSILTIFLILYCYVCSFSSSIVRASIMSIALLFGSLIGEQNDALTNLSLAGIILLLLQPLELFNLGFILSFCCVFGIITLYPIIFRIFEKIKLPKIINAPMSICLTCQIATLPIILNNFEFTSALGIITNIVCLPLFSFAFCWLFLTTIFGLFLPFMGVFLIVPEILLSIISSVANFISSLDVGIYRFADFTLLAIILFLFIIFFASKFVMLKSRLKIIFNSIFVSILILIVCLNLIPQKFDQFSLIFAEKIDNITLLATENNKKMLVNVGTKGTQKELELINEFLKSNKIMQIDSVALIEFKENTQNNLITLCNNYSVKNLFLPQNISNYLKEKFCDKLKNLNITYMQNGESEQFDNLSLSSYYYNEQPKALHIFGDEKNIVFCASSISSAQANFVKQTFGTKIDILRVNNYNNAMFDCNLIASTIIANNILAVPNTTYINLRVNNSLIFKVEK